MAIDVGAGLGVTVPVAGVMLGFSDGPHERAIVVLLCVLLGFGLALFRRGAHKSSAVFSGISVLGLMALAISPFEGNLAPMPVAADAHGVSSPPGSALGVESVAFEDVHVGLAVSRTVIDVSPEDVLGMIDPSGARNSGGSEWYREHGGAAAEIGMATIVLRNTTAVDLTVTDITAQAKCAPPEHQTYVSLLTGSASNAVVTIGLDLEAPRPRAVGMDFREGPRLTEREYFLEHSLKIGSQEQETVKVFLQALSQTCEAQIQVHYTGQDGSDVMSIDNGGEPFAVTGIAPERIPGKPYSGYDSLYVQKVSDGMTRQDPAEFAG